MSIDLNCKDVCSVCSCCTRVRRHEVDAFRTEGDAAIDLLQGTELFGPDDAAELYDGLHPTPEGHRRIGERFAASAFGPDGAFGGVGRD